MVKKRAAGNRSKSLISVSVLAHDMMILIDKKKTLIEMQKLMDQKPQTQRDTIDALLKADCIERIGRGEYKLTNFGKYILPILKIRRSR